MKEKTGKDYLSPESKKKLLKTFAWKMALAVVLLALAIFLTVYWNK
ncbi:MAG: hypothetical protein HDT13_09465 [Butyrivibrio sp.]|nr:hypothetical protein [Butyrivibrio sp.]